MVTSEGNAMANTSAMHLALQEVSWLIPLLWQPECWDLDRKIHSRCVCVRAIHFQTVSCKKHYCYNNVNRKILSSTGK